jgi:hypothetical protein
MFDTEILADIAKKKFEIAQRQKEIERLKEMLVSFPEFIETF